MINFKEISATETYPIRHKILRPHQPFEDCKYVTDFLNSTFHIGGMVENTVVSVASFSIDHCSELSSAKQYRLRAMATLPEYRRQNIGKAIVTYAEEMLRKKDTDFLWCKGRVEVEEYYRKLGFKAVGKEFDYPGLGSHIIMVKELK